MDDLDSAHSKQRRARRQVEAITLRLAGAIENRFRVAERY